jgi:phage shock protein C
MEKRLYRDEYRKKIAGVCAGLSDYLSIDPALVRLFFVLACIFHGGGLLIYIILWIVLPKRPYPFPGGPTVDYTVPPQNADAQNAGAPGGTPFGSNPFPGNTYGGNPFPNQPFETKPSGTTLAAIIIGVVLILVGGAFLFDNLDIWPDWEYWKLWPVVPITVGLILMLSGDNAKKKARAAEWQAAQEVKPEETTEDSKQDTASTDDIEPKLNIKN